MSLSYVVKKASTKLHMIVTAFAISLNSGHYVHLIVIDFAVGLVN